MNENKKYLEKSSPNHPERVNFLNYYLLFLFQISNLVSLEKLIDSLLFD